MTPTLPDNWIPQHLNPIANETQRNDDIARPIPNKVDQICKMILKDLEMVPLQRVRRFEEKK